MNPDLQSTKEYIIAHRTEFAIGAALALGIIGSIIAIIVFVSQSSRLPEVVYKPVNACDMFTAKEAKELLGERINLSSNQKPVQTKNTAVSKCGYTDANPETENMIVAAIMVRSGINDEGVKQNKDEFNASKPREGIEVVKDLGEAAYFNEKLGQLNILRGQEWIILSYGIGEAPGLNTVNQAVEFAKKVLENGQSA